MTLVRRCVLRQLIWVCTVFLCPTKRTLGSFGLRWYKMVLVSTSVRFRTIRRQQYLSNQLYLPQKGNACTTSVKPRLIENFHQMVIPRDNPLGDASCLSLAGPIVALLEVCFNSDYLWVMNPFLCFIIACKFDTVFLWRCFVSFRKPPCELNNSCVLNVPHIVCGGSVFIFGMHYLITILVLQSSWRGREIWLFCFYCLSDFLLL